MASTKKKEYNKKYREMHKEEIAQYAKEYRDKNKEDLAIKKQIYCEQKKEEIAEYNKKWGKTARETKKTLCVCGRECAYRYNKETHEKSVFHVLKTTPSMVGLQIKISGISYCVIEQTIEHVKLKNLNGSFSCFTIFTYQQFEECGGSVICS